MLQSEASANANYNAKGTGNYDVVNLPFDPTSGFHEYRFDWIPGRVTFLADGKELATLNTSAVPTEPGHVVLSQWSNGNRFWSAGPPVEDALMTLSYVKAYFNSSLPQRQRDYDIRCEDPAAASAVCPIPDQNVAPDPDSLDGNATASTWFFSQHANMSTNQTVYRQSRAAMSRTASSIVQTLGGALLVAAIVGWL